MVTKEDHGLLLLFKLKSTSLFLSIRPEMSSTDPPTHPVGDDSSNKDATPAPANPLDAFKQRLFTMAVHAQISSAIAIGIELDLFKSLASAGSSAQPARPAAVAATAGA